VLLERASAGGRVVAFGRLGENLEPELRRALEAAVVSIGDAGQIPANLAGGPQVVLEKPAADVAIGLHGIDGGVAVHLVRYDYDEQLDAVPPLDELVLTVRVPVAGTACSAHSPGGELTATAEGAGDGRLRLRLEDVPLYGIVELR
jgi:hypothetical protein